MKKVLNLILFISITSFSFGQALLTDADINNKFISYGKAVGIVAGNSNVTLNGTAAYSIPIYTPDGINGMEPTVSINYNSGTGNGLLGYGWYLSAYSSITYDSKNIYHDNNTSPNYIDGNSPYLLNGERLIPISGNTEFRTEAESFHKITASSASTPASFTVFTKSGIKMEYGITTESKLLTSNNVPVKWYLSKITDQYDNYVEYFYNKINGEIVLDRIIYTKHPALLQTYTNTIQFNYISRSDENIYFSIQSANNTVESETRKNKLSSIDVFSESGLKVRRYDFVYGTDDLYTYLNEVIETGYDNLGTPAELNSTIFKYGTTVNSNTTETYTNMVQSGKMSDVYPGDFNGDGLDDVFMAYYTTDTRGKIYSDYKVFLRNTTGNAYNTTASASGTLPVSSTWSGTSPCNLYNEFYITDVDGNGIKDITIAKRAKIVGLSKLQGAYVLFGNATATSFTLQDYSTNIATACGDIYAPTYFLPGDFDGDGKTDWLTFGGYNLYLHFPGNTTYNKFFDHYEGTLYETLSGCHLYYSTLVEADDADGDGKDEIIFNHSGGTNGNTDCSTPVAGVVVVEKSGNDFIPAIWNGYAMKEIADFNGDGKADILTATTLNSFKIRYSTGKNYSAEYTFSLGEENKGFYKTGDINGDGKHDLLHYMDTTADNFVVYYSNGTGFKREAYTISIPANYRPSTLADVNGDGRSDIIDTLSGGNGSFHIVSIKPKGQERLLTKIKDGYERLTEFQYKLCTETGGIYTLSTAENYPLRIYTPKINLVYRMISPDGSGNMSNSTYSEYAYANATMHAVKGALGFKSFKQVDAISTLTTEQTTGIINTSLYLMAPTETKTYYAATPGTLLTKVTPSYTVTDFGNKRFLLKTPQTTALNYVADAKVMTDISMNDDGNVSSSVETIMTVAGVVKQTNSMTVKNSIFLSSGSWMPYLPEEIVKTTTYTAQTTTPYTVATKYTYNGFGKATTTRFFNNDATGTRVVEKTFEYDTQFGILLKTTTTPSADAARYTRFEYFDNKRTLKKTFVNAPAPDNELCTQEVELYDPRLGLPTKVKHGYYTNTYTEYKYDAFGRTLEAKQMPNNITTYTAYSLDNTMSSLFAIAKTETTQAGAPTQTSFYDRFGRTVKSGAQNFAGNMVYSETTYNSFGNTATTTAPDATNAGTGNVSNTYTYFTANPNTNHYRLEKINNSLSGITQYTYYTASNGSSKTKITSPSTLFKEQTVDITGKLITAADNAGSISYTYNSQGNAININAAGTTTIMDYDAFTGAQTILNEPNSGNMSYKYNGFGELIEQTDAKGVKYQMQYDVLGRLKQKDRVANGAATPPVTAETITYEYVAAGNDGAHQLQYVKVNSLIKQTYAYDAFHRSNSYTEVVDASNTFTTSTVYNANNSILNVTYPNNYTLNYTYEYGNLKSVNDGTTTLYTTTATNKYNQPTAYTLGNTKASTITYFANGSPSNYSTAGIQNLNMVFNMATANMDSRTDNTKTPTPQTETFTYEFDRLKTITTNGTLKTNTYVANGNITYKPDAGNYTYHSSKKNQVTNISFTCSGSVENYKESQTITYTPFNKAATLQQVDDVNGTSTAGGISTHLVTYSYNPNENRNKSELKKDGVTQNVRYYHGNYEKFDTYTGGVVTATKHIYYINGGNGLCAIATKEGSNPAVSYTYVYTDHLGSILKLTNNTGSVTAEQSFDAWGRLRNPNNWNDYSNAGIAQAANSPFGAAGAVTGGGWLTRGYTGHEHVPQVDLINMNGRMYDAVLGRMLSPDRYVQDATNTQAYNRYSYVVNNPLKYTDPSGWLRNVDVAIDVSADNDGGGGGGGGGAVYVGKMNLTGHTQLTSWGTTMLSGMFYAPSQQYYINPITGGYMFGNQVISRNEYINGKAKNEGRIHQWWSSSTTSNVVAYPDKDATLMNNDRIGYGYEYLEKTDYYLNESSNTYVQSDMYPTVAPVVGFVSSVFSGLEKYYDGQLNSINEIITKRGKVLGVTRSIRIAKAETNFLKEATGAIGKKILTPISVGLSIFDLGVAANNRDGWGALRAGSDLIMTGVGVFFPVAGLVYFGATITYDLYQMSKEP